MLAYPERYQKAYGYWRPVIRTSIEKFIKCGDLKEGFATADIPETSSGSYAPNREFIDLSALIDDI